MRFHVVGLGSIGSLVSHHLSRALPPGHSISLILKNKAMERELSNRGRSISVENRGVVHTSTGFDSEVFEDSENGPSGNSIESLFVTSKAHQTIPIIFRLLPRLSANTTIVLMQNGMGVYEELVTKVFQNSEQRPHFILATNNHGAYQKGLLQVIHSGIGNIEFGIVPDPRGRDFEAGLSADTTENAQPRLRLADIAPTHDTPQEARYQSLHTTVAALLLLEPLNVSWRPMTEMHVALRRKLVVNSTINPLTAIMGCRNGDVFKSEYSQRILRKVCSEAARVFAAQNLRDTEEWLKMLNARGVDRSAVEIGRIPVGLTSESLQEECLRVAEATSRNISSMLADIRHARPTEIGYLNGYLCRLGVDNGIKTYMNSALLNLVRMRSSIPLDQMV